ncbi:MAG: hypothetical protein CSB15_01285 [Clostridiales bacterium]|nr:MAG: hypothetical protein CSB15_01285 [Clostridiales bacterium]
MAFKIEALWDCEFCNGKGIKGSMRNCTNCGNARGDEVQFYLPENIGFENAVDEEKVSKGPDWICEFCGGYSSSDLSACVSCGAPKEKNAKNYFDIQNGKY